MQPAAWWGMVLAEDALYLDCSLDQLSFSFATPV